MEALCVLTWASLYRGSPAEKAEAEERKWCQNKNTCSRNLSSAWFPLHPTDVSEVHRFPRQYKGISTTDSRRKLGTLSEEPSCQADNINSLDWLVLSMRRESVTSVCPRLATLLTQHVPLRDRPTHVHLVWHVASLSRWPSDWAVCQL